VRLPQAAASRIRDLAVHNKSITWINISLCRLPRKKLFCQLLLKRLFYFCPWQCIYNDNKRNSFYWLAVIKWSSTNDRQTKIKHYITRSTSVRLTTLRFTMIGQSNYIVAITLGTGLAYGKKKSLDSWKIITISAHKSLDYWLETTRITILFIIVIHKCFVSLPYSIQAHLQEGVKITPLNVEKYL